MGEQGTAAAWEATREARSASPKRPVRWPIALAAKSAGAIAKNARTGLDFPGGWGGELAADGRGSEVARGRSKEKRGGTPRGHAQAGKAGQAGVGA